MVPAGRGLAGSDSGGPCGGGTMIAKVVRLLELIDAGFEVSALEQTVSGGVHIGLEHAGRTEAVDLAFYEVPATLCHSLLTGVAG